ncbi:coiled-coil domain-containing protein 115 [Neltuma alba]|uniref:coiled-coil domain-containing protein 115 n=1 Tax=Neltuma alba TaxID=207710 RepID=UPI0010A580A3|nr:coiled-coil domain-containing protein 115-like [Prosopis alba]XP_028769029.1 coiled-coil domain-containing protein 115-like [Prosopis alba]
MEEEDRSQKETGNEPREVDRAQPQQLQLRRPRLHPGVEEKLVLQFMDSMHNYLSLFDALSSTLRQGWLDLASARHSMGGLRINSSLLNMKLHSAATTVKITQYDDVAVDSVAVQPCFTLRKWVSSEHGNSQLEDNNVHLHESDGILQSSAEENAEVTVSKNLSEFADNDQFCKERSKSLSMFGILISPKLRAARLSFERALETLVAIANMQSSVLYSFHQLHQEAEDNKR